MLKSSLLAGALGLAILSPASAEPKPAAASAQAIDRIMQDGFKSAAPDWQARLVQDETQQICSATKNAPSDAQARAIVAREKALIQYPADGRLMGDWKKGAALAQSGYGLRFTDYPPRNPNGGNCYACHQLDKKELSFGTLGPSLYNYGKTRNFSDAAIKLVYERIYNPHASQACANMPRLGANKVLDMEQIKDLVAYVMSPDSPVNK